MIVNVYESSPSVSSTDGGAQFTLTSVKFPSACPSTPENIPTYVTVFVESSVHPKFRVSEAAGESVRVETVPLLVIDKVRSVAPLFVAVKTAETHVTSIVTFTWPSKSSLSGT